MGLKKEKIIDTSTSTVRSMLQLYNKLIRLAHILFYFSTQQWGFADAGVRALWGSLSAADRVVFPFDIADISWDYHAETFLIGLRVYLVKDDLSSIPEARKRWRRLFYLHQLVKLCALAALLSAAYALCKALLRIIFA